MKKLDCTIYGIALYIDSDEESDVARANNCIKETFKAAYDVKPSWHYKAKARHTLGLD